MKIKNIHYYDFSSNKILEYFYIKKDKNYNYNNREKKFSKVTPGSKFENFLKNKKIILELKMDFNLLNSLREYIKEENIIVSSKAHDLLENDFTFNKLLLKENIKLINSLKELFIYYSNNKKNLENEIFINLDFDKKINISNKKEFKNNLILNKNEIYEFIFSNMPLGLEINVLINSNFKELRNFFIFSRKNKNKKYFNQIFDEINKKTNNDFYKCCEEIKEGKYYKN